MSESNLPKRDSFGSKLAVVAAAAGSAIGLGNIYRFPCEVGANGGGAFILVYLLIVICLGVPMIVSEFVIGRRGRANAVGSFKKLTTSKAWPFVGVIGIVCAFFVLAFYSTVSGWTLDCIAKSLMNGYAGKDLASIEQGFTDFNNSVYRPLIWQTIFMLLTAFIIYKGVKDGIEKYSKILMPLLFVIMILLCIKSLTLPGAREGLAFLFNFDFSKITGKVLISALGQVFFSLSVGMGALITYGSYISKKDNLVTSALSVTLADTLIAILAGIVIFPAALTFGVKPEAGTGLVFNTLPMLFNEMAGGYFFCLIFFILLAIAALTSTISLLEVLVAFLTEEIHISRNKATILSTVATLVLGAFATISLRQGSSLQIAGVPFFDALDYLSTNILLPIGGFFIVLFVGWYLGRKKFFDEITNEGTLQMRVKKLILFVIKFLAPVAIVLIFISRLFLNIR